MWHLKLFSRTRVNSNRSLFREKQLCKNSFVSLDNICDFVFAFLQTKGLPGPLAGCFLSHTGFSRILNKVKSTKRLNFSPCFQLLCQNTCYDGKNPCEFTIMGLSLCFNMFAFFVVEKNRSPLRGANSFIFERAF